MTWVISAYVNSRGQAWADFDVYMPERWAQDTARRQQDGIPEDLEIATKPDLAIEQITRRTKAGLPVRWAAFERGLRAQRQAAAGLPGRRPDR